MPKSEGYYLDPEKRIYDVLINNAAREVQETSRSAPSPTPQAYSQLEWTDGCRDVLTAYHTEYYSKVRRFPLNK
jgi:hypothetical protein